MSSPPSGRPPLVVRIARFIRHAPGIRRLDTIWHHVRPAYHRMLAWSGGKRGLPIAIGGVGTIHVPPGFLAGEVDPLEIPMLQRLRERVRQDSCFYDVGASVGLHSLVAGTWMGAGGEIHAFEPDAPSCASFQSNTAFIGARLKVQLSQCFVSDKSTTMGLNAFVPDASVHRPTQHLYLFAPPAEKVIPQIRLDDYISLGMRPPTIIKCDIEGAELLFLEGATQCLRQHRPILFISLHPDLIGKFANSTADFYSFLRGHDYDWEILNEIGETHLLARPVLNGCQKRRHQP